MYISKFQLTNFKSYRDSTEVEFKPGFNIITGQNNAGKTALLEALTLQFIAKPHRSARTIPVPGALPQEASIVRVTFGLTGEELLHSLQSMRSTYFFPAPNPRHTQDSMNGHLESLIRQGKLRLSIRFERRGDEQWFAEGPTFLGIHTIELSPPNNLPMLFPASAATGRLVTVGGGQYMNPPSDVRVPLAQFLRSRIYRFRAERFNPGQYAFGDSAVLAPDASNLPQVLNTLNSNPARFDQLNAMVTRVLPQVRQVSVRPVGSNQVEILVWSHDPLTQRSDLAIPLNESGSGIGQVLAILYVVMTSDHPQVIIVDEPQSFLHPGAVRKLIEVLKEHPQHQYILATHSPAVITASDPTTFTIARATDGESVLEVMDPSNAKHLQSYLSEIGARLSDVFGADNILWVEGQTEEECFPLILKRIANRSLMGTAIVGIRQTGDLQGREKRKVLEMYRGLSEARTLLPPAIAFVFDQECLSQNQKDDLTRMDPDRIHFLPRGMYENHLLNAGALAAVMNCVENFREAPVTEQDVSQLVDQKRQQLSGRGNDLRYFCRGTVQVPDDWIRRIDAAGLLRDVFQELSGTRVSYEKTTHSVAITEWLIEHNPGELREIADFLAQLLPPSA